MCPFFGCGARIGTVSAPGAGSGPVRLSAVRPRRRSPRGVGACGGELHESSRRPHAVDSTHILSSSPCCCPLEEWPAGGAQRAARSTFCVPRGRSGGPQQRGQPFYELLTRAQSWRPVYTSQLAKLPLPVIVRALSLAVRVTCLEALGILLYSICALAKMEGLAAISLQIDVVPDFNLNGERIRWVTEQSIRTSVSRPGTRIREVPWVTWKRSRNSWSGGHPLLSFCLPIDDSWPNAFPSVLQAASPLFPSAQHS